MGEHDALFKRVFSVPEHAAGEIGSALPAPVVDRLDLARLELVPGSFVSADMTERHTDLLFRAPLRDRSGDAYVYMLLEHQSQPDPLMPFRVLEYQVRIWRALLREDAARTSLPPIAALVVHHGRAGWTAPRSLHELIEGLPGWDALAPLVPNFQLALHRVLGLRFGALSPEAESRLERASTEELEAWLERSITAERLDEVLG